MTTHTFSRYIGYNKNTTHGENTKKHTPGDVIQVTEEGVGIRLRRPYKYLFLYCKL